MSETNALSGVTTHVETTSGTGALIRTTTNPDGGTRTETYYLDGTLKSITGTGVHGVAYGYGTGNDVNGNSCTFTVVTNLHANGNPTAEWTQTFSDMAGRTTEILYADGSYSQSFYNAQGQLAKQIDPDGVMTLYQYEAKGSLAYQAVDLNQNGVIDFGGTDRITQTTNDVVTDHGTTVRRSRTYVWAQNGVNASSLAAVAESSADGLQAWQTKYASATVSVVNHLQVHYTSPSRTMTSTAPDGSYSVNTYSYGRLLSGTNYDSTGVEIGGTTYMYDPHGRKYQAADARNGATTYG